MITPASPKPDATAQLAEQIESDYRDAVCRLAEGADVPQHELREALMLAGRTPQALQNDVAKARQRKAWSDDLAEAADLDQQAVKVKGELQNVNGEIAKIEAEFRKQLEPLTARRAELQTAQHKARLDAQQLRGAAQGNLRRTASPSILAEIDRCQRQASGLANQLQGAGQQLSSAQAAIRATAEMRQAFDDFKAGKPAKLLPHPAWLRKGFHGHPDTIPDPGRCDLDAMERYIAGREAATAEQLRVAEHTVGTPRDRIKANAERIESLNRQCLDWRSFGTATASKATSDASDNDDGEADETALRAEAAELKAAGAL